MATNHRIYWSRLISSAVLLVAGLGVLTQPALASPHNQTVPTMPPASSTPTSTGFPRPTATRPTPTLARPTATSLPPTQTAIAGTATTAALTSSPTSTVRAATGTSSPTQVAATAVPPLSISTSGPVPTQASSPTTSPQPAGAVGRNLGLVGIAGGAAIVVVILLLGIWLMSRRQSRRS